MSEFSMTYWIELEDKNGEPREGFGLTFDLGFGTPEDGYVSDCFEFTPPIRITLDDVVYGFRENDQEVLYYREIS